MFDVAVIGGGILGASAAFRLSQQGKSVVVLEAREAAAKATGNTFAWLNAVSKEPEAYHRLNALGMAEHRAIAEDCGADAPRTGGSLTWRASADETAELRAHAELLRSRRYAAVEVDRNEMLRLEPGLRIDPSVEGGVWYEGDAWVDAVALTKQLLGGLNGDCEVREGANVTGIFFAHPRVIGIDVGAERMDVRSVLICAGVETPHVASMLGVSMPVEARAGLLAVTEAEDTPRVSRVIHAPGVHLRPESDGGLRVGSDELDASIDVHTEPDPPPAAAAELLKRADSIVEGPGPLKLKRAHIGVRPWPADGVTIAGRLPGWENAYVAVTHSGVTLGPLLGRLLASEILGSDPAPELVPFRPDRFTASR